VTFFKQRAVRGWTASLLFLAVVSADVALADDPQAPVLRFQDALISAMKDGERVGFAGRRERMEAMVDSSFDLRAVTRAIIGRHYESLTRAQRAELGQRVRRYAVTTFAARFSRYEGERFEPTNVRAVDAESARVSGRFMSAGGSATDLGYAVHRSAAGWRIVNVWFDGVSGTDIQRAEFEVFLRNGGVERLKGKLDELITRLESGAG
jgi:phospholipid transport system substrate-binding protein